jgi:micrococcal nuclease
LACRLTKISQLLGKLRYGKLRSHPTALLSVILLLGTLSLASCQSAPPVSGQPVAIATIWDGQTFEVLQAGTSGLAPVIKLAGIEVPDSNQQPWGPAARQTLRDLTRDRIITARLVSAPNPDSRIRWAYVWAGEQLLNQAMVAAGHAYINPDFAHPDYADLLQHSQDHARVMGYGIWNPDQPLRQTAADFRRQGRGS